jgi:hypothetical protein
MRQTLVFFRDDDVGEMSDRLRGVMDILLEASAPCNYQVVPEYLNDEAAGELKRIQSSHSDLIFLNQHGFKHRQIIRGEQRATEFSGGRSYASQFRDIELGRDMLASALGDRFAPELFTPPCHKYDVATLTALGDLGFSTLSAGVRVDWLSRVSYKVGRTLGRVELLGKRISYHSRRTPDPRLCEVSVAIDVHEDIDGNRRRINKTADRLWAEFEVQRSRLSAVGVMLHHEACDTREKHEALRDFVDRLASDPAVRIVTMTELAQAAAGVICR